MTMTNRQPVTEAGRALLTAAERGEPPASQSGSSEPRSEAGRAMVEHIMRIAIGLLGPDEPALSAGREQIQREVAAIEAEARAASPKGERAAAQAVAPVSIDLLAQAMTEAPPASRVGIHAEAEAIGGTYNRLAGQAGAPGLDYSATWREFEAYEDRAAKQGSGMSRDQMTGASMMLGWLCNRDKAAAYAEAES